MIIVQYNTVLFTYHQVKQVKVKQEIPRADTVSEIACMTWYRIYTLQPGKYNITTAGLIVITALAYRSSLLSPSVQRIKVIYFSQVNCN